MSCPSIALTAKLDWRTEATMIIEVLEQTTGWLASAARGGAAAMGGGHQVVRLERPLVLYEYEGCPMCRRVREAVDDLALPTEVRPCPRRGVRFRPEALSRAGRAQFPFLVDPNAGIELLESDRIVEHLYRTYGAGSVPARLTGVGFVFTSQLASLARAGLGFRARPSRAPAARLELRSRELDPDARRVRERLCALELPYLRTPGPLRLHDPASGRTLTQRLEILDWLHQSFAA